MAQHFQKKLVHLIALYYHLLLYSHTVELILDHKKKLRLRPYLIQHLNALPLTTEPCPKN
jgi:hypothetical protein